MNASLLPNEQDIAFFQENGYWVAPKIISDDRLEQIIERMERVYEGEYETGRSPHPGHWKKGDNPKSLRKTDNSHWSDTVLRSVATDPIIGEIAGRLMQTDLIRLWHDQLLYKPGPNTKQNTANVGWHQDYSYWQCCAQPTLVTAWVAFTDVDLSNGCMQVVPRSNQWGLMNASDFFEQDLQKLEEKMELPEGETFQTVPLVMKAGQVSFHHALTIHGSGPNMTDQPRRSMAVHLMTGDTRYKQGSPSELHMNVGILGGSDGDVFEGAAFPILWQQS